MPDLTKLTDEQRKEIAGAVMTLLDHASSGAQNDWNTLATTFTTLGWLDECEDCNAFVYLDQPECVNCGHVNGRPDTGSTPDDRPMQVCKECWANVHVLCLGSPGHDGDPEPFCNCARLGHPDVTATPATTPPTTEGETMTTPSADDFWAGAEVIHTYTRAQAIADGVLIDVSEMGAEAGFRFPVAMTQALHAETVAWDERNTAHQDEKGRLWDVLMMAVHYGRRSPDTDRVNATVLRIPNTRRATVPREVKFTVHIGPGDTMAPVITLMLPHED